MLYIIEHAEAYVWIRAGSPWRGTAGGNMATVMTLLAKERKG
ncbi:MAG: hypothetical protein ACLS58_07715 [Sutterella wadsworthensis]